MEGRRSALELVIIRIRPPYSQYDFWEGIPSNCQRIFQQEWFLLPAVCGQASTRHDTRYVRY
ncbi:hypothetical protein V1478_007599 [Vespula squamosa]|uniref:Uncharacterized protein n=1 Tax=Vespula squamosa TaxID=30214 RepID=A0ABD2B3Q2_VESSQ